MSRIAQLVTAKHSWMRGNDFAMCHDANLVCCGASRNGLTGGTGWNAIAITIHSNQAG